MLGSELKKRRSTAYDSERPFRSDYEIDKQRIVHSEAFRRLQSKTQFLQTSESDFHRNRLTHSIEVAQIGRSILSYIKEKDPLINQKEYSEFKKYLDADLIEGICLAHDIGHPPFGHGGEIALNYMMKENGGFEGNAQTLRIVSKLAKYYDVENIGINPTRRFVLGVLKYPFKYSELKPTYPSVMYNNFHSVEHNKFKSYKCFYDSESDVVNWALEIFNSYDREQFTKKSPSDDIHKTFDCSVMDLADDISYVIHDFEDAIELKMFSENIINELISFLNMQNELRDFIQIMYGKEITDQILSLKFKSKKTIISSLVWFLITNVKVLKKDKFSDNFLDLKAELNGQAKNIINYLKQVVNNEIILSPHNCQIVKNGQIIVCQLFDALLHNPEMLPKSTKARYDKQDKNPRVICDYVSGMTDRYAIKVHTKIFSTDVVSYFEK